MKALVVQRGVQVPVVLRIEGDADEGHAVPLGGGNQAPSRIVGEAGLDADAVGVELEQAVVVLQPAFIGRVAEFDLHDGLGADEGEVLILQGHAGELGKVKGGGIVPLCVQPAGGDIVGVVQAKLLSALVHRLHKALDAAVQAHPCGVGGVVAGGQQHPAG